MEAVHAHTQSQKRRYVGKVALALGSLKCALDGVVFRHMFVCSGISSADTCLGCHRSSLPPDKQALTRTPGKDTKFSLISRLGSRSSAWLERLGHMAAQCGIDLRWDGTAGDSHDSHKLILLAMDHDAASPVPGDPNARQNATVLAVYGGMFERGHDVSERAALVDVAVRLGLAPDAEAVLAWLDSDEANRRVDAELARPRRLGINGIPSYVVQGRYRVGGMQEPGVFLDLFDRIRAKELGQDGGAPIGEVAQGSIVKQ